MEPKEWHEWLARHSHLVERAVRVKVRQDDVEDVVMESMVRAMRAGPGDLATETELAAKLKLITRRSIADYHRRRAT